MVTRTFTLTDDANAVLERAAQEAGKSVEELVVGLVEQLDERRRLVAEGRADVAAGRTVDNEAMKRWLESWGSDDEKDPPLCHE